MKKNLIVVLFFVIISGKFIFAQNGNGKISGLVYMDYYYNINHHNEVIKDLHGFWIRRIYVTYDYKYDKNISTRIRLEMNNDGSYSTSKTIVPFIKDAYLAYKFGYQKAVIGISSPPTYELIEKIWSYRAIEKTPLDLQRMASSRDFGLSLKGNFDKSGKYQYHAMFSNGAGNKQEIDKGKSFMLALNYWFTKNFVLQLYGDYADRAGVSDSYIQQAFVGYNSQKIKGGIQYSRQIHKAKEEGDEDVELSIASLFLSGPIANKVKLVGRIDRMFNANPAGEKVAYTPFNISAPFTEFICAVDYKLAKSVSVMPNIKYVLYDKNDSNLKPENDFYANLTFYWKF